MFNCYAHNWSSRESMCPICPSRVSRSGDAIINFGPVTTADNSFDKLTQDLKICVEALEKISDYNTLDGGKYLSYEQGRSTTTNK